MDGHFHKKKKDFEEAKINLSLSKERCTNVGGWLEDGGGLPAHWILSTQRSASAVPMGT
jgi:hypothetical protein